MSPRFVLAVGLLIATSLVREATAAVHPVLDGSLKTFCTRALDAHPKRAELTTVIADDRLAEAETVLVGVLYRPHPTTTGRSGRVVAKATLVRADGSREGLGTFRGRQEAANLPLLLARPVSLGLAANDRIVWSIRFQGFEDLAGCFDIAAVVGPNG